MKTQYTLPCSVVLPGVEVVGRDVSGVEDVTTVGSISVVESDEIEVVSVWLVSTVI